MRSNALKKIKTTLQFHTRAGRDLHLLFTGYRGNGKTTELYQLQSSIAAEYQVIYFDASRDLDLNNLTLSDLLLAIAKLTVEAMTAAGYRLPNELLEDVGDWFFETALEKSHTLAADVSTKAELGIPDWFSFITARLFSRLKISTDEREIMRRKLEKDITALIEKVNTLLDAAREQVKRDRKTDLLVILDSLDRLRQGLDKNLFHGSGAFLQQLQGNFIYVVPISLLYDEQATLSPFDDQQLILPTIPIYQRGLARKPHTAGISTLKTIISQRLVMDEIFAQPQATVDALIQASGGHLRDLMKLIGYACSETDDRIHPEHAQRAINRLTRDYERAIRDEEYEHIIKTYKTQDPPNNEINRKLIYNNVILVYEEADASEWKDVHPAVVRTHKFQRALNPTP